MNSRATYTRAILPAVFWVSFATIGWQLALMRCLLISRYHHFSFLVISCALLGFGASGTFLCLAGKGLEKRMETLFRWGLLALAISIPACFRLAELFPVEVYFAPMLIASRLAWWAVFWLTHLVPFLLAGALIGLALMTQKGRVHLVYAFNLAGSAAGAIGTILMMNYIPANGLAVLLSLCVLVSGLFLLRGPGSPAAAAGAGGREGEGLKNESRGTLDDSHAKSPPGRSYSVGLVALCIILMAILIEGPDRFFPLKIDQYKTLAYVQRLVDQGEAKRERILHGPRGRIELYSSAHFHTLLSLGSSSAPPPMDIILRDGFQAGALVRITGPDQAGFLQGTLSSLPYALVKPQRVLILGESGGLQLWLSRMSPAQSIVFVQPDRNILRLIEDHSSQVTRDPRIQVVEAEPRAFLDANPGAFDIIYLAGLEGFAAGSGGIGGLREDYLATVEGFAGCLKALTEKGLACVVRGVQDPPRDNIKIAATWIEAFEKIGIRSSGNHLLMARDELACATLVSRTAIAPVGVDQFKRICKEMSWDVEWYPGIQADETNRVHILPGPEGSKISWYHHALRLLLSGSRESFYSSWFLDVRPATDDRPFFFDFFRWASISKLRAAFGPMWPARAEMGFLVLILAAGWTAIIATVLTATPIIVLRRAQRALSIEPVTIVTAYFGVLGIAFMFIEMSFIQIFTRFLGEPVLAAALVVGGFLLFAGLGSFGQPFVSSRVPGGMVTLGIGIACLIGVDAAVIPWVFQAAGLLPIWCKTLLGLGLIAPPALLMGSPFPWGLSLLQNRGPEQIPLAWAVNGFSSVVSTSIAVLLAMAYGFTLLLGLAAVLYLAAGGLSFVLAERYKGSASGVFLADH